MSLKGQTLLKGHTLQKEGYPFDADGNQLEYYFLYVGHGKCSCGALSPELPSKSARQRWHREHKAQVRAEQAGQPIRHIMLSDNQLNLITAALGYYARHYATPQEGCAVTDLKNHIERVQSLLA